MKIIVFIVFNKNNLTYLTVMATEVFCAKDAPMELIIDPSADNQLTQTLEREMGVVPKLLMVTNNNGRKLQKVYRFSFDHPKAHLLPMYKEFMEAREKVVGKTLTSDTHDILWVGDSEE